MSERVVARLDEIVNAVHARSIHPRVGVVHGGFADTLHLEKRR